MRSSFLALLVSIGVVLIGCQPSDTPPPLPTATDDLAALAQAATPIPTAIVASDTPPPPPTSTATAVPTEPPATATIAPTDAAAATATPTITPAAPTQIDHYLLQRPIPQEGDNIYWLDATYPYGSTQFGAREVHLGVEFVNSRFTPVIAAADGTVIFAGQDDNVMFGPRLDYYGNLVVVEHSFSAVQEPVYTLYAHLQDIAVQTDDTIAAGERVGRVGDTGIAIGPHLHFEVRVGDARDYRSTRNPALWLRPYPDSGTLAGRVTTTTDAANTVILVRNNQRTREITTYAGERVNSDAAWDENFALPDLPAGQYEVIVSDVNGRSLFRESVAIQAGATTFLDIALGDARPRYAVPSATPTATSTP